MDFVQGGLCRGFRFLYSVLKLPVIFVAGNLRISKITGNLPGIHNTTLGCSTPSYVFHPLTVRAAAYIGASVQKTVLTFDFYFRLSAVLHCRPYMQCYKSDVFKVDKRCHEKLDNLYLENNLPMSRCNYYKYTVRPTD